MNDRSEAHRASLAARNAKVVKVLDEGKTPLLGIFWIHPKTNQIIEPYTEPLEHGREDHELGVTDATSTHPNIWNLVKGHHPDLSSLKYDQVPRGRIFFDHQTKKFHVWGPASQLSDPYVQGQVLSTYNLDRSETIFEPNGDYELEGK